ncbi:MAG: T9SS type A sorting domain-containing protein [Bacteroidetes bacterium]|nr:T9SS type A sorting domain-containing protein [Bacteroidota bacterium]MBK9544137.1 T9SS type A sorting domain-containing protein [Bacteroidota bacterium]MBP6402002.1 T9SS type A sorting domain-containing protein [Bacteroidia bacterium]
MKLLYSSVFFLLFSFSVSAQLTGINPNSGFATQNNLTTTITSAGLFQYAITQSGNIYEVHLEQGAGVNVLSIMDFGTGWWNGACTYVDPNTATLVFNIPGNQVTGVYDLVVTTTDVNFWGSNLQTFTLPACFTINPPDGYITGKIYFDANFNGIYDVGEAGLSNQVVILNPGSQTAYSNASGDYSFGVMNGSYTVAWSHSTSANYVLNSDSASYTVTVNSANISGLDFGGVDGLVSMAPGTAFQGQNLNSTVVSRDLFLTGANPYGNISYAYLTNQTNFNSYSVPINSFTILDTNRVQFLYTIPLSVVAGTYQLTLYISNQQWILQDALIVTPPPSYLTGHVYYDANSNGQFDTGEVPISNQKIQLTPDNSLAFSDANGDYTFGAALGTHTATWVPSFGQFVVSSQPSYTFTNTGNQGGFDFGLRSTLPDYTTNIYFNPAFMRCNQSVTSFITYTNRSNAVAQGTIYMVHSPNIIFGYVNPPRNSWNGDTTFWTFSNLQPMETRSISLTMVNPGVGSTIWYDTHIDVTNGTGTIMYSESSPRFTTVVRCSFDPNDKAVTPEGVDDVMHYTLLSDSLDYLIRFQNSGNDTAFTVFIRDTIDVSLDLSTFELLASSHTVEVEIDSNRAVTFLYNNILLPDSNVDEPNSHGYVRYRIHPMANLPDPTRIENQAFIYFDQNPAIETNITWNTMVNQIPVGLDHAIEIDNAVTFYPNPMDKTGQFIFRNDKSEQMIITLVDLSGKEVLRATTNNEQYTLNKGNLSGGLYFFRLINSVNGETHAGKITIR